jgi:hypothetical protein
VVERGEGVGVDFESGRSVNKRRRTEIITSCVCVEARTEAAGKG